MVQSNGAADSFYSSVLFRNFSGSFEDEDDDEHEDEPLVADFGASSVERSATPRAK